MHGLARNGMLSQEPSAAGRRKSPNQGRTWQESSTDASHLGDISLSPYLYSCLSTTRGKDACAQPSEPIFFPKLWIYFAAYCIYRLSAPTDLRQNPHCRQPSELRPFFGCWQALRVARLCWLIVLRVITKRFSALSALHSPML